MQMGSAKHDVLSVSAHAADSVAWWVSFGIASLRFAGDTIYCEDDIWVGSKASFLANSRFIYHCLKCQMYLLSRVVYDILHALGACQLFL